MNSMTGFGRATTQIQSFSARVEISGVNRKQAEIAFGLPRACTDWEQTIRPLILKSVSRGRVYVSISFEPVDSGTAEQVSLNEGKFASLLEALKRSAEISGTAFTPTASDLVRLDIIHPVSIADIEQSEIWPLVEPAFNEAFRNFLHMRSVEGSNLKQDLLDKLETLRSLKASIAEYAPGVPVRLRENMVQRLQDAGLPVDLNDERIIREIALFSDKCDVSEELSRLDSHFSQFLSLCESDNPPGRPLDFLCQEIFREFNTIGSKANDASLAHLVVTAKTELEKIREQVQNIE